MGVRISGVLLPSSALGDDLAFYTVLLGADPLFVDGDRYTAFPPSDGVGLALGAAAEAVADRPALVLRVDDAEAEVARAVSLGGAVDTPVTPGPHERRAVVLDPSGNPIVISQKNPPAPTS